MGAEVVHRIVFQVSRDDADGMNIALNNLLASQRLFESRAEKFQPELVAYGPGITMLRQDKSPVKDRIEGAQKAIPELVLSMCGNAKAAAEQSEGNPIPLLTGVRVVPSGVVRVIDL